MKKIIISILFVSTLFGLGGAVLANTIDVEKRVQIETNVAQMVESCKEFMGFETENGEQPRKTCNMEGTNQQILNQEDPCLTEGQEKVID
ncbi:hypothetical protein HHO41_01120 [Bacillus sp. DNRA2]|uniref:hypothetical protein n=1 Tax=Bacillus sp. DNRA2 TaxID=2723053 RepID=UPI00145C5735|nr:hypothetical protein [Bacillus sp. DNRA2]NMD68870.1 hypothetical protein [Bacillus sp. DNRA2]